MTIDCLKTVVVCIRPGYYGFTPHGRDLVAYNTDGGTINNPAPGSTVELYGDVFAFTYAAKGQRGVDSLVGALKRGDLAIKQTSSPILFDGSTDEIRVTRIDNGELATADPNIVGE